MSKIRRLNIDNTNGYKRRKGGWLVRYKSIRGCTVRRVKKPRAAAKAAPEVSRTARRRAESPRWSVDWVVVSIFVFIIFFGVFMYNALRGNHPVAVDQEEISGNITYIERTQTASAEEIEESVSLLNDLDAGPREGESERARYMRLMGDAVVVGDSLTEGLTVYGWLSDGQVFSEIGASVIYADDMFGKAAALHPKYAFFAFGMNDMGNYRGNPKPFIERYNELLDKFAAESPKTRIFICSISVPRDSAIRRNKSIGHYKEFNDALRQMAKDRGVTFVDSTKIFLDHPELYAGDGIHAQPSYYPYWLDNMIRAAGLRRRK